MVKIINKKRYAEFLEIRKQMEEECLEAEKLYGEEIRKQVKDASKLPTCKEQAEAVGKMLKKFGSEEDWAKKQIIIGTKEYKQMCKEWSEELKKNPF